MGFYFFVFLFFSLALAFYSCGQESKVDCDKPGASSQCIEKSDDEKSVLLLNEGKSDEAILLLEKLIAEDSGKYYRHARLAAAYASKANLDFIQIAETLQSGTGEQDGLIEDVTSINKESTFNRIFYIHKAINVLESVPPEHRKKGSALSEEEKDEKFYSASAFTQLFLYIAVHTQMCEKTLTFIAVNLSEKDAITGDGKAKSCGPIDILGNLGTILTQVEGCDICSELSDQIGAIQKQFLDYIGEETDIDAATSRLLEKLCQDQQGENPEEGQCGPQLPPDVEIPADQSLPEG